MTFYLNTTDARSHSRARVCTPLDNILLCGVCTVCKFQYTNIQYRIYIDHASLVVIFHVLIEYTHYRYYYNNLYLCCAWQCLALKHVVRIEMRTPRESEREMEPKRCRKGKKAESIQTHLNFYAVCVMTIPHHTHTHSFHLS